MELASDKSVDHGEWKPKLGMEFDSELAAYEFYNAYGRRLGFSIRKNYACTNKKTGEMTSRIYVCSKEGVREEKRRNEPPKNPRSETRTGCLAKMGVKLNRANCKFKINSFEEEHNHKLAPIKCSYMMTSQQSIFDLQPPETELAERSGSAQELLSKQVGGRECLGFTKVDQKSYLRGRRMKSLAYGEVGNMMRYFRRRTVNNPSFYYDVQFDSEEQITNIFWADARMIIDYSQFGDIVSFDTTNKINKECRPFVVFIGFNHHRETVVFGAALMYDETAESFSWLFETFLEAMSNKPPKTILTEQDATMAEALSQVMPSTFHRLCKCHIMQNVVKHVSNVGPKPGCVKGALAYFMDHIDEEDDFVAAWEKMLDDYSVRGNDWLNSLFALKKKWANAYVRLAWTASMKGTQLNESFCALLKDYLRSDYDVVQFLMHFEMVLAEKRHKELEADLALSQNLPKVKMPYKILLQARNLYTKSIFEEFQAEYFSSIDLITRSPVEDDDGNKMYTVDDDSGNKVWYVKRYKSDDSLCCSCRLFEMSGILCRHALKILREELKVRELPTQYILKRWTRYARSTNVQDMHGRNVEAYAWLEEAERYRILMTGWRTISDRAAQYKDAFTCALQTQDKLQAMLEEVIHAHKDGQMQEMDDHSVEDANTV
ncbi:hypothetical protein L1049_010419 [Liquidambar formosana]|uniref:Protein FAR1-RELATED SEQUENCE n=1 Tax=Liquidambar formosana TaxID=63359 RepID=A0AAP0N9B4_LIQFO